MLLKGVAGVPGDLLKLWEGPQTLNVKEPKAWDFTNHFKGHYKSEASNHWDRCSFDKVRTYLLPSNSKQTRLKNNAI